MTRNKKIIGAIIVVIILSSFMFGGDEKPIKVLSVKPEIRNVEKTVSNTRAGTIDACRRSKMSPAAAGQISRRGRFCKRRRYSIRALEQRDQGKSHGF